MHRRTPTLLICFAALAAVLYLIPNEAQAWPTKFASCTQCHKDVGGTTITTAINGAAGTSVTVAAGGSFEIDFKVTGIGEQTFAVLEAGVPTGWTIGVGTSNSPAISGWHTNWDATSGANWEGGKNQSTSPYDTSGEYGVDSPDGRVANYTGTAWELGRGASGDDAGVADPDGQASVHGGDLIVNVPGGASDGPYTVVVAGIGHIVGSKGYVSQAIAVTVGAVGDTTTLGAGTDPSSSPSVGPGAAEQLVSRFSLVASAGTDTVTALDVTLAAGTSVGVAQVVIEPNGGGAAYGTQTTPAGDVWSFSGLSVPVTTSATDFEVRVTPKAHGAMPAVPGASYAVTATVSGIAATNTTAGADSGSDTLTIDNLSPGDATWGSNSPGNTEVTLAWTNPGDGDLDSVVVLRHTATVTDTFAEGDALPTIHTTYGSSYVEYVGSGTGDTAISLTNGQDYYFKVFSRDTNGNWSAGVEDGPIAPLADTTTLSAGTDPSASPAVGPGGAETLVSRFGLQTSAGTDTITALDVTLAAGTSVGVAQVTIEPNGGGAPYGTDTTAAGETWSFTGMTIPANTGLVNFEVRITPNAHGAMPAVPGASYAVTATVGNLSAGNSVTGSDTGSDTLTIDNLSPGNTTWGAINTPASGQIELNWSGGDVEVLVLSSGATISDNPAEGNTSYSAPGTIGSSDIEYVGAGATVTVSGLTNGNNYYFKAFTRDANGNWSVGLETGPHQPVADPTTLGAGTDPSATPVRAPGGAKTLVSRFSVTTASGSDTVATLDATLGAGTSVGVAQVEITGNGGAPSYGTDSAPVGEVWSFSAMGLPVTTSVIDFEVHVTPKTHAAMPAVPGASYAVTATVGNLSAGNTVVGSDSGSDTVTIDNLSPADTSWGAINLPASQQIELNWTNPGGDFAEVLILRDGASISQFPVEGNSSYVGGGNIGGIYIQYVGSGVTTTPTGLTNGNNYYFKAFSRDANGNWAAGVQTGPHQPVADTTALSAGTDPALTPAVGPGGAKQLLSRFGLQTSGGTDTITSVDVTLAGGTSVGVAQVEITGNGGAPSYGTDVTASGETWTITGSIPANTGLTNFEVHVTPKVHGAMPGVPGASYAVTATVGNLTASNTVTGSDTGSDTVTIDNLSPADATWGATTFPAGQQLGLNWTNPGGDFAETLILRNTASISDNPVEGNTTYSGGGNIGTSYIQYVGSGITTTATSLTNGQNYYFKAFSRDANDNWAAGAQTGPHQPVADPTTLGAGTDPALTPSLAPGGAKTLVSRFSVTTASGSDTVATLDATLAGGTSVGVAQVEITGNGGAPSYGTDSAPVGEVWSFAAMGLPVTTSVIDFEVHVTPKTHAAMPAVPGASYAVTATVGNLTAGNTVVGSDTGSDTVTIDNLSAGDATWGANSSGDTQVTLAWTNPGDGDLDSVVVLRHTATVPDTFAEGDALPTIHTSYGSSYVEYVGSGTGDTAVSLTNGQDYYFKVFSRDTSGNWSAGVEDGPIAPLADTTLLSAGTDPSAAPSLNPGGAKTLVSRFGIATSNGVDTVTSLDVTLAGGTSVGVAQVEVTGNGGAPSYGTDNTSSGETWTISGAIPATTSLTNFEVHVTPKAHGAMPGVPGASYAVTAIVGNLSAGNTVSGTDTGSDTVTIDNLSPGDASWGAINAGDNQVGLNWTNPGGDFVETLILRNTSSISDNPGEGNSSYSGGGNIGSSYIQYVGGGITTTATSLTNGQDYYFKAFTRDTSGNWAAGIQSGPHAPQDVVTTLGSGTDPTATPTVGPGDGETLVSRFSLQTSSGTDTITGLDTTFSSGSVNVTQVRITGSGGSPVYGTDTTPSGELWSFSGMSIPANTGPTQFEVHLTPKTHGAMPAVPGASYAVTATVGNLVMGNTSAGSDSGSDTVTVDNLSPNDAAWGSIGVADTQLTPNWTNPGGDFAEVMILRNTAAIGDAPTEGSTYVQGNSLGGSYIQYVGSAQTVDATGLTNDLDYYFKAFTRDANGNWAAGVQTGPHQATNVDTDGPCAATDLRITTHDETNITVEFTAPYENCIGTNGNVTAYMVRHSVAQITAGSWGTAGIWNDNYTTGLVAAGANQSITLTGLDSNTRYWVQVKALDDFSNVSPIATLLTPGGSCDTASACESTHLHSGWNISGSENNLGVTNDTCLEVYGVTSCMYWVSTGTGDWAGSYSDTGPDGAVFDGWGYWLGAVGDEDLVPPGDSTVTATYVEVTLQKGMNLISNPHPDAVMMSNLEIWQNGSVSNTWANAIIAGWVLPSIYAYDGSNYYPEIWDSGGCMHSRHGYWVKLNVDDANTYSIRIPKP